MSISTTDGKVLEARIYELGLLQESITKRVAVLKEQAGIEDDFEGKLQSNIEELGKLVADRLENEDVHILWQIYYELSALTNAILRKLSGFAE